MPAKDSVATNAVRISNLEDDMKEWKDQNKEDHKQILSVANETHKLVKDKFYKGNGYEDFKRETEAFLTELKKEREAQCQSKRENWGFVKKFIFNALQGLLLPGIAALAYLIFGR